jgi:xanthine dehydrogenase YagT iron-sulfur-binding subunit
VPDDDSPRTLSRRRFLVGGSAAAVVSTALEACREPVVPGAGGPVFGPGKVPVDLRINGSLRKVEVEPRATLADTLRFQLGMTGTKVGCDRGSCSACTVWVDGIPVSSCTVFVLDAAGHDITTVEGIARGEELHPVQEAFIEHDAMQCGFCIPGMIMSCVALVERVHNPTLDDVRAATSGNLCRCACYPKVFEATLAAARAMGAAPGKGRVHG